MRGELDGRQRDDEAGGGAGPRAAVQGGLDRGRQVAARDELWRTSSSRIPAKTAERPNAAVDTAMTDIGSM